MDAGSTTGTSPLKEPTGHSELKRRLKRSLRRYAKSLILLAIAVVTGLAALFTFRSDSSVFPDSRLTTFLLTAFGNFVPDYVHIYLLPIRKSEEWLSTSMWLA
jgi:hypothetical protein